MFEGALVFSEHKDVKEVVDSIIEESFWEKWINSSSKSDLPPDFYNKEKKYMMEVMMFDDKAKEDGSFHGTKKRESELLNELRDNEIEKLFPNLDGIMILGDSKLETDKDHNFMRYKGNFKRVIKKHSEKATSYHENHPGYELIFFVFDESSGIYFKNPNSHSLDEGTQILAKPHLYWIDKDFIQVIKNSRADYLIWYKPYNSFNTIQGIVDDFPKVMIYKVDDLDIDTIEYDEKIMESNEI